ncbi:MAG: Rieske 2Fe-2S domain-containing protein [Burkholderiaceae bacterium]
MLTHDENMMLCRVQGDAPMGALMRRHWVPALLSEEVPVADGKPVRVRLFGEDLVAFRDTNGKVGLIDEFCPHRRASLVYGRNEDCGLRCLYHGWKIDAGGNVVEMFSEPAASELKNRIRHTAYPTHECGGFVWAYMGPEQTMPAFSPPPFVHEDAPRVSIVKIRISANWAQITEGQIDSAHSSSLHSSDMRPARVTGAEADDKAWYRPSTDKAPRLQVQTTPYGFQYAAIRRPIHQGGTHEYVRVTRYVAPFISLIPPNNLYNVASVIVPIDDENSMFHFIAWGADDCPDSNTWREFCRALPGKDLAPDWSPLRTMANDFGQDRKAMTEGSFTGIAGIPNQDIAMWVGMGPIVDRTRELLGGSDVAIVAFRRLMVDAAARMRDTGEALGRTPDTPAQQSVASYEGVIEKESDWRERQRRVGARPASTETA